MVTLKDIKAYCEKQRDNGRWCGDCHIKEECRSLFINLDPPCLWDEWDIRQVEAVLEGKT